MPHHEPTDAAGEPHTETTAHDACCGHDAPAPRAEEAEEESSCCSAKNVAATPEPVEAGHSCCGHDHEHHHDHGNVTPSTAAKYFCPMCPGVESDKPGDCPKCGMALERNPSWKSGETLYTCPMHPEIVQDHPGRLPHLRDGARAEDCDCGARMRTTSSCAT